MPAPALLDQGPFPPRPRPFNVAGHTFSAADRAPERVALEVLNAPGDVSARWTHATVAEVVRRTAGGLAARGLGKGDRVLLRIGTSVEFPILLFAANALGANPVPTSTQLTEPEARAILDDLDPRLICVGVGVAAPTGASAPILDPDDLAALTAFDPAPFAATDPEDSAYIVYTSGTSGRPKGGISVGRARPPKWAGLISGGHPLPLPEQPPG